VNLKETLKRRQRERREAVKPRMTAFDGNSGMTVDIDGRLYYRDIQGRYYEAASDRGHFYEGQIERGEDIWYRLEGSPQVIAEKVRLAKYYAMKAHEVGYRRAPQPDRPFLP
jgi:hypothetical protein